MLWDRRQQCEALDGLLAEVRAGRSRVLVIRGEAGIGKTALLGYAADTAPDFRVARADGVESEMELPFAALHQLLGPMLGRAGALPAPQRDALGVAFGLRAGGAPDRFLVGLAVLGLLSEVAADQPLLGLVDDAQWLDQASAQALGFAARRLDAESVALLFGTRDQAGEGGLAGLPGMVVAGLSDPDARALLALVLPGRLDDPVRDRIIAESGGNPLALHELPSSVTAADLAGGFGVAGPQPVAGRIEQSFRRRIAPLPAATRLLLLLTAARRFEPLDVRLARETYLEALSAAVLAGRRALGGGVREVAAAARTAPPPQPVRAPDLLLDGLALVITEGYPAAVPMLRQAVSAFRGADVPGEERLRWLWQACHGAGLLWDYGSWDLLSARRVEHARNVGALAALPIAFNTRVGVHLFAGEFTVAASLVAEVESVSEATGSSVVPYAALGLVPSVGSRRPPVPVAATGP